MSLWFFASFVLPAAIAAIAHLAVLWNEREVRKHNIKPGE